MCVQFPNPHCFGKTQATERKRINLDRIIGWEHRPIFLMWYCLLSANKSRTLVANGRPCLISVVDCLCLTSNLSYLLREFLQSVPLPSYAGYMICTNSLSQRLGALYVLYCLYETQPFKPPFKIYLSLGMIFLFSALSVIFKCRVIQMHVYPLNKYILLFRWQIMKIYLPPVMSLLFQIAINLSSSAC